MGKREEVSEHVKCMGTYLCMCGLGPRLKKKAWDLANLCVYAKHTQNSGRYPVHTCESSHQLSPDVPEHLRSWHRKGRS